MPPPNVPDSEEIEEIESENRKHLDNKMKDPNIMPHDYYNENILTVFAPQSKVTPEQVYWPLDVEKMKAEELKAKSPLLFATPTVYPPIHQCT